METARASLPRTLYPSPFPRGWEELESGEVMDKTFSERLSIFKHHLSYRDKQARPGNDASGLCLSVY